MQPVPATPPCKPCSCEPGRPLHVAVLLSGGVDSSLSLRLLKAAGHHCKAFYLQIWFQEDFRNFWDACPWEADLEFARKVRCGAGPGSICWCVHERLRMLLWSTRHGPYQCVLVSLPNRLTAPEELGICR